MNLFSFRKSESLSLIFDIRDTSISVAATRFSKDKKPEIVYCQNIKIDSQDISLNTKKYLNSMLKTIDKIIISTKRSLIKIGNKDPIKKYYFFFGSPWSVSQSKIIKVIKDKSFIIDNNFLEKTIIGEGKNIEKKVESQNNNEDWTIIEEKIIQSKLNGYKVQKIYDRKTKEIEMSIFVSFAPQEILNKVKSITDKKIDYEVNSSALSSFVFLRDLYNDKNDFIYIDISETVTDICIVKDDVVFGTISFPFGEKNIVKEISNSFKIPEDIVTSSISIKCHGKCDKNVQKEIDDYMEVGMKKWLDNFNETITKICSESDIPSNIFMIGSGDLINTFSDKIKTGSVLKIFKDFGINEKMNIIDESVLDNFITNGFVFKKEPYVKIDVIFLSKNINKK